ncbi:MarR family winged helix-turn-helix transcriptional regulator [Roseibium sediminis]|uniref:MarR family winged helix-turn-helix transcriptional regulator n=1 Tax=Roseibium sediminis TaxID=1775174 RepID=UPI00123CFE89|nr:MarR family transcriptional regulator [Roseibium sediminis]
MTKTDQAYAIIQLIRPVHRRLARAVETKLAGSGISVGMRAVMEILAVKGKSSVPEIARNLFLKRQQIQLLVNELEAKGYLERGPNPAHKRSPLFALTKDGLSEFERIRQTENMELEALVTPLSQAELASTEVVLRQLLEHFSAFEDDPDNLGSLE